MFLSAVELHVHIDIEYVGRLVHGIGGSLLLLMLVLRFAHGDEVVRIRMVRIEYGEIEVVDVAQVEIDEVGEVLVAYGGCHVAVMLLLGLRPLRACGSIHRMGDVSWWRLVMEEEGSRVV